HIERLAPLPAKDGTGPAPGLAGARVDTSDPLAVLIHGKQDGDRPAARTVPPGGATRDDGPTAVPAPPQGTIVRTEVAPGDEVPAGATVAIMEAMKMEHVVTTTRAGIVREVPAAPGDAVHAGHTLVVLEPADVAASAGGVDEDVDLDEIRPDLAEVLERHA